MDSGGLIALVSHEAKVVGSANSIVKNRTMVISKEAFDEIQTILRVAGRKERLAVSRLLMNTYVIPNSLSEASRTLRPTRRIGRNDINIFGTGDYHGIQTLTTDAKALRAASAQGVDFDAQLIKPMPLRGF